MVIDLKILKKKIEVKCEIEMKNCTYTFALASNLNVSNIINNGLPISVDDVETIDLDFRPKMKKYSLKGLSKGTLQINYSGKPEGNFAFFEEEFIHFSFYNGWYPTDFDVKKNYEITIHIGNEYKILNASYNKSNKCWQYIAKEQALQDCNIICVNTSCTYSIDANEVSIYWYDCEREQLSKNIYFEFVKICDYYRKLYGHDKIGHMNIVFAPTNTDIGAYMREGLIVFSNVTGIELDSLIYTLGHEIAHAYASGADINTYNDWLNETSAEWSSYLYLLENKVEYFKNKICLNLDEKLKEKDYLHLKCCGENRPDNVHLVGTLIYYEIYKKYGKNAITELLQIFDRLNVKNTDAFLNAVEHYNYNIAELIKQHI